MKIKQEIIDITEAIKSAVPAERIYLFGSHAYGTPNEESDYDFFVLIPDGGIKPIDAMMDARKAIRKADKWVPIDVLADYKSRFFDRSKYNTMERIIARDGVILYERT